MSPRTFPAPAGTHLLRELGAGSTFEVALVSTSSGPAIAKRARRSLAHEPVAEDALGREASALRALAGPIVPRLFAEGVDEHGAFVLESVAAGRSLRELEGPVRADARARGRIAARVARALASLHDASDEAGSIGFVHGDPAPDHFVVTAAEEILVLDFGASTTRSVPAPSPSRGTLPYVAPELCRGESAASRATDRYALAVILAELFVGPRLAPRLGEAAMLLRIGEQGHDLAPLAALPASLRVALAAQLARDPGERPADLAALTDPATYAGLDSGGAS